MKHLSDIATLAAISATLLIVSAAPAISQQGHGGMSSHEAQSQNATPPHQHDMMGMSAMQQEPHHVLAMAYRDNLVSFARALQHQAARATTVDPEFGRAAVAEMKRSFNQMEQHHQDHMKTMDDTMKARMADAMKEMDAHEAAIKEHLAALEHDVHTSAPDSTIVSQHVAEILKDCNGMPRMHAGTMDHKMAGPADPTKK